MASSGAQHPEQWPSLPLDAWRDTYATLHMWTQIVGKIRLVAESVAEPLLARHALRDGARAHHVADSVRRAHVPDRLRLHRAIGSVSSRATAARAGFALEPQSVAAFYAG